MNGGGPQRKKSREATSAPESCLSAEALIDDARRETVFGLLMSLNMLIEFGDAFDYPLFSRRLQLPIHFGMDLLLTPAEHVLRGDVAERCLAQYANTRIKACAAEYSN